MLCLLGTLTPATALAGAFSEGVVPETGLRYWEWHGNDALFRLTQRLPDQTRGFFLARGFNGPDADLLARNCVFQTLFKNSAQPGGASLGYDLEHWAVHTGDEERPVLTREHWARIWQQRGLDRSAQIAFEWSLLPTRQVYEPQDYNWGMTSFGLEPGSRFDLSFSWQRDGTRHSGRLRGVECAPDIHPDPPQ
jgi:hypothetical protein